jgi:N6-L-threonylcarbamoyladenine synthase
MIILGIESSCDETAAAVLADGKLLSNLIATQAIHQQYGGVVPELASRAHQEKIVPVVQAAIAEAGITLQDLDGIAVTNGPGLLGALLVGASFAKGLALALQIPLVGVNHTQGHILSHFLTEPAPKFPFLCLTVSGGHTQLVVVRSPLDMEIIGQTEDDAAGEAFDKAAKLLGLPYPGGPLIDQYAQSGNPKAFQFPKGNMEGYNYSFSGIKTAIMYFLQKQDPEFIQANMADICASIQHTLVETLLTKLKLAIKETGIKEVAIAGGVAANSGLRQSLQLLRDTMGLNLYIPPFAYCTDNAAMIAMAGHFLLLDGRDDGQNLDVSPNLKY